MLFTSAPERYPDLPDRVAEVVRCDTNDVTAVRNELDRRLPRSQLAGITTTSEYYVEIAAALAAALGLPGNPPDAVRTCRDKAAARRALAAAGVAQPRYRRATGPDAAVVAAHAVGLPCVVKPVRDSGSLGVRLCHTAADVRSHAADLLTATTNVRGQPTRKAVLVEQRLTGRELSVEMFSAGGRATCVGISEKVLIGAPYFVEDRHIFPAALADLTTLPVIDLVADALAATGIRHGPTHTEVRLTPAGPAVVEINARLAGGMIPELIRLTTGADLVAEQLRAASGRSPRRPRAPCGSAGVQMLTAGRAGVVRAVRGVAAARAVPGVVEVSAPVRPGREVRPPRSSLDRLGYVIAVGDSGIEVAERLAAAAGAIQILIDAPRACGGVFAGAPAPALAAAQADSRQEAGR